MSAYQDFLEFFSMHNKERLDGLDESYFTAMNEQERNLAYTYLLKLVENGGTEESMNGLFRADFDRATEAASRLLVEDKLNPEAQIAAAWNLSKVQDNEGLFQVFAHYMSDSDRKLRAKAAYYVPENMDRDNLKSCLKGMIRTETEQLPRIHAVNKILALYGVSKSSIGEKIYREIYRGLHSDELRDKEQAFGKLEALSKTL